MLPPSVSEDPASKDRVVGMDRWYFGGFRESARCSGIRKRANNRRTKNTLRSKIDASPLGPIAGYVTSNAFALERKIFFGRVNSGNSALVR